MCSWGSPAHAESWMARPQIRDRSEMSWVRWRIGNRRTQENRHPPPKYGAKRFRTVRFHPAKYWGTERVCRHVWRANHLDSIRMAAWGATKTNQAVRVQP